MRINLVVLREGKILKGEIFSQTRKDVKTYVVYETEFDKVRGLDVDAIVYLGSRFMPATRERFGSLIRG